MQSIINEEVCNDRKKVKDIIADVLGVREDEVVSEAKFEDDLGADSLDIVEMIMAIEEEFDIEVPEDDAAKMTTVGDVMEYVALHAN